MTSRFDAMKEKPLILPGGAPIIRAVLEGRKSQFRVPIKPQPTVDEKGHFLWNGYNFGTDGRGNPVTSSFVQYKCPFGEPGQRLWVRETFGFGSENGVCHKADEQIFYRATDPGWDDGKTGFRWKPPVTMPRFASRITLEIVNVRVQRLQEISASDITDEGVEFEMPAGADVESVKYPENFDGWDDKRKMQWERGMARAVYIAQCASVDNAFSAYQKFLESIHGPGSWSANPFVWVREFRRVQP